jgi:biotin carboxylase
VSRLFVLGSGGRVFREYALRAIAQQADIILINDAEPTWERAYLADWAPADLTDHQAVLAAIGGIAADGLLTYDERYVELAALLGEERGFIGPSRAAVHAAKDKTVLRAKMDAAATAPVRFAVAHSLAEASAALETTGLPAVFKPRALGGSAGVRLVSTVEHVAGAFEDATTARVGSTKSRYDGVLIEEYVDGPEFSVDSVTANGVTTPLVVAEKHTAFAPYFEEVGHVVPQAPGSLPPEALDLVCQAHAIAGLDNVVSHAEVRIGRHGPRLIELNARLGGDLIPYLGQLAYGVDLPGAAAQIALGRAPTTKQQWSAAAAAQFIYPEYDMRFESAGLRQDQTAYPGLDVFEVLAQPGQEVMLPPRRYMSRLAAIVVSGASRMQCQESLGLVVADVVVKAARLSPESEG